MDDSESRGGESKPGRSVGRKRALRLVLLVVAAVVLFGAFRFWRHSKHYEGTDDAQVDADIVNLSPKVPGTLTAVYVVENQHVNAGDPIAQIDPTDYEVAVKQAEAAVAQAQAASRNARNERARAEKLVSADALPKEEGDRRASAAEAAAAALQAAQAQLDAAKLRLSYCRIVAPASGVIGKKSINAGDRVEPGQQLVAISKIDQVWVTANFRETQLRRMAPGQRVDVHVDATGQTFHGRIESFGGATGARFSVLPPENATGNYVKVVQRIPVRIVLDPGQPGLDRLRPGMSVEPTVRIG